MNKNKPFQQIKLGPRSLFFFGAFLIFLTLLLANLNKTADTWSSFTTIFLGIFIEALPFLLLGTLASGIVEVFVNQDLIRKTIPRSALLSTLAGSVLGLLFPVCECGVVPLVRRLYKKGLPPAAGIAFLLAAPVINPIVIFSTATAFGFGSMFFMRIGFTLLIANLTGLVFASVSTRPDLLKEEEENIVCLSDTCCAHSTNHEAEQSSNFKQKIQKVLQIALDEFFEMGRYLVIGGLIAAGLQTLVPQNLLLSIGQGPLISVLVMLGLAVILSICSTVDSFVALGFMGIFSTGSVLGFLLFGPMVDIKSILMFTRVFKKRTVLYIVLLPFLMSLLICTVLNYFIYW